jgi:hypothetical protein
VHADLLMFTFRVWFLEIALSGFNYIFPFAYLLVEWADIDSVPDFLLAGTYWLLMVVAFEWIGSLIVRRPVHEILEGWHVERGYM